MNETEPSSSAVKLFLSQDEKNDALRGEIGELKESISEFSRRLEVLKSAQEHIKDRVEEGVSKTAFKAWEAVQEMRTVVANMDGRIRDGQTLSSSQEKRLDRIDKFNDKVIYGILIVVFLSVFSTVMAFLWSFRSH